MIVTDNGESKIIHSYPWYVSDWLNSEARHSMTPAQRGVYRDLLDQCYLKGSLPTSVKELASLAATNLRTFVTIWEQICNKFAQKNDGRYHHQKVDEIRSRMLKFSLERISSGQKGATSRWGKKYGSAIGSAKVTPALSIATAIATQSSDASSLNDQAMASGRVRTSENDVRTCAPDGARDLVLTPPEIKPNTRKSKNGPSPSGWKWEAFQAWWAEYWRRTDKKPAWAAYHELIVVPQDAANCKAAMLKIRPAMLERDQEKRPMGATWLHRRTWLPEFADADEIPIAHDLSWAMEEPT